MLGVAPTGKSVAPFRYFQERIGCCLALQPELQGREGAHGLRPKSRVWRHVVQRNRAMISDRTDGNDHVALNRNEEKTGLLCDPRFDDFWSLVPPAIA